MKPESLSLLSPQTPWPSQVFFNLFFLIAATLPALGHTKKKHHLTSPLAHALRHARFGPIAKMSSVSSSFRVSIEIRLETGSIRTETDLRSAPAWRSEAKCAAACKLASHVSVSEHLNQVLPRDRAHM